jgi:hypothetical protein
MRWKQAESLPSRVGRALAGAAGVVAGLFLLRSIPDLIRYLKMQRM